MLLADQVGLLRECVAELRNQRLALPLMGGIMATRQTYRFKSLVHPARDIATMIGEADPGGNKLPARLRGWNLDVTDGFGNADRIHLRKLLGMIVHVYYLRIGDGNLDVSNDEGRRVIVPYDAFLDAVERLLLTPEEICLVICGLTDEKLKRRKETDALTAMTPGAGDLMYSLLAAITRWPDLRETVWTTFFAHQGRPVEAGCQTVNNQPFLMGGRYTGAIALWHIGWRRDDTYAQSWVDISRLVGVIQDHFAPNPPKG